MSYPELDQPVPVNTLAVLAPRAAESETIQRLIQSGCLLHPVIGCHALTLTAERLCCTCEGVLRYRTIHREHAYAKDIEVMVTLWSLFAHHHGTPQLVIVQSTSQTPDA